MKLLKFSAMGVLSLALSAGFASCSDDDDNGGGFFPGDGTGVNAYINGVPSKIGDVALTTDAQGRVTEMKNSDDQCDVTIKYEPVSRATNFDGTMTIKDWDPTEDPIVFYFQLNDKGFIKYALEIEGDQDQEEWWFDYNAAGQLTYMKRTEGGNEVTNITYTNGDITSVKMRDEDGDGDDGDWTISYGATPIENKGCLMLFDETFGIDMDEMMYGYLAGLLGNATTNLPVKNVEVVTEIGYGTYTYTENYAWTINANGFPTMLTVTNPDYPSDTYNIPFAWAH